MATPPQSCRGSWAGFPAERGDLNLTYGLGGPVNPFDANPFGGAPNPYRPPQPPPPASDSGALATLSVVFAFVFAPVGALLGHLALSQNQRSLALRTRA